MKKVLSLVLTVFSISSLSFAGALDGLQGIGTSLVTDLEAIVPYALPVVGVLLVVGLGMKIFKRVCK